MKAPVDHAPASHRLHHVTLVRAPARPASAAPASAFARPLVSPPALLDLQRLHGNRFVQRLLARRAGARHGPPIQRTVTRAPDGEPGAAGWTRLENFQWVWKDHAEARWNAITAVYAQLEALYTQLGAHATQHDNHARIRRARYAMHAYTIKNPVIDFDKSEAVLNDMTAIRDRAQAVIATPPAPDDPGPLTAHTQLTVPAQIAKGKAEKTGEFEVRQKLHDTKQKVNKMVADMDAADRAHGKAKTVRARYEQAKKAPGANAADLVADLDDARLYVEDAWRAQQEARSSWRLADQHPYRTVIGTPVDKDVDAGLKRYTAWWKKFGDELTALDRFLFTIDKQKPGALTPASLENGKPEVFRTLVILGKLTVTGGNTYKAGGNKTFAFNETKDWELHLHEESTVDYQRGRVTAHYKPMSDRFGLGYNTLNPVDMATLHRLKVDIS